MPYEGGNGADIGAGVVLPYIGAAGADEYMDNPPPTDDGGGGGGAEGAGAAYVGAGAEA